MSRTAAALSAVLLVLLASCTSDPAQTPETDAPPGYTSDVDVDTPQLRALKEEAGVEPCTPGTGGGASDGGLPDITLRCLGGGPEVNLASLRGPLVINLWAQWCGPCREELPYYQQLHEQAGDTVDVLGIDYQDTQPGQALELVRDSGVTYPLLADPAAEIRAPFRVRGLPGVLLVDEQGRLAHLEYTVIRSYDQLRDLVEQHLDVRL